MWGTFAVPSNIAKKIVEILLNMGNFQKGILGIVTVNLKVPMPLKRNQYLLDGVLC